MYAFLFDIDGTLLNTGGAGRQAVLMAVEDLFGSSDSVGALSCAGKTDLQIMSDIVRGLDRSESLVRDVAALAETYPEFLRRLLPAAPRFRVYPGVCEVLQLLCAREDCAVGLLTGNFPDGARIKLEHAGLWHYFSFGVFGDISEDRDDLARAARSLIAERGWNESPENTFVIGDTVSDIRCGRAIGATTVALVSDFEPEERLRAEQPDYLLRSLPELAGVLSRL